MNGRPPTPTEQKKLLGTYRPDRVPLNPSDTALARATLPPSPIRALGKAGTVFWESLWVAGVNWVSPQTDIHLVQLVAEQFDERDELRALVMTNAVSRDRSGLRELEKQIVGNLAALGLNPSDRARLGFAAVKTESKLDEIIRMRREHFESQGIKKD